MRHTGPSRATDKNTQTFRVRARIYGQNVAILRLPNKDIQPGQKVSISLSL